MAGPLDGIRVLEMTEMITGPLAGMMLSDLGADVVKVERPGGGDVFRSFRGGNYSATSAPTTETSEVSFST